MCIRDRKKIEIQENHSVWDRYAAKQGVHLGIRSYLQLKTENFYRIEERQGGSCFVTARGWEDLSRILQSYEEMKVPITEDLIGEYVQHEEVAGDFYGFYKLFKNYEEKYQKYSLEDKEDMLFHVDFEGKVLFMQLLEGELQGKVIEYQQEKAYINAVSYTHLQYYPVGDEMFVDMLEDLKKAEHFIFLEYFIIHEGKMWNAILEILEEKVKQGVDVRLIYDDMGCVTTPVSYTHLEMYILHYSEA